MGARSWLDRKNEQTGKHTVNCERKPRSHYGSGTLRLAFAQIAIEKGLQDAFVESKYYREWAAFLTTAARLYK